MDENAVYGVTASRIIATPAATQQDLHDTGLQDLLSIPAACVFLPS